MQQEVYKFLNTITAITDVVSDRIFPSHIPQTSSLPAISMVVISMMPQQTLDSGPATRAKTRLQIDVWDFDVEQAQALAELLRLNLDGFVGDMNGKYVGNCILDNQVQLWEASQGGDDVGFYHIANDFLILHQL